MKYILCDIVWPIYCQYLSLIIKLTASRLASDLLHPAAVVEHLVLQQNPGNAVVVPDDPLGLHRGQNAGLLCSQWGEWLALAYYSN